VAEREEILQAVRLHAAQNGGVALGKRAFEKASGIRESSWVGKYWARWNDLLIAAGFGPNKWNEQIHTKETLTETLAMFTLELGHYPTAAERNLRHRTDPSMPFDSSFASHIGNRADQVRALMTWAIEHPEYRDVYDLVAPLAPGATDISVPPTLQPSAPGRVYLVRSGTRYKIGKSDSPDRRYRQVQLLVPDPVQEVHVLETDDPAGIELYWHRRFADKRRAGEWFDLDESDVAAFKRRGQFM
jgi:Meiotically up-regulated gene 113